jgi:hypothetical protein
MSALTRAGLAVAATGALVGIFPVHAGYLPCGSAFVPDRTAAIRYLVDAEEAGVPVTGFEVDGCDRARQPVRFGAGGLLVLGAALSVAGLGGTRKPKTKVPA